jgi:hypothetical protein
MTHSNLLKLFSYRHSYHFTVITARRYDKHYNRGYEYEINYEITLSLYTNVSYLFHVHFHVIKVVLHIHNCYLISLRKAQNYRVHMTHSNLLKLFSYRHSYHFTVDVKP